MPSSDKQPKLVTDDIEQERLRIWREKRAKVAEKSKQERLKQADAERQERQKAQEEQKALRMREAADLRARQEAEKRAERMNAARSRIAGRTDIEAARKRLLEYRKKEARAFALRIVACVLLPTALVAAYLFAVATPLYVAQAKFSLVNTEATQAGTPAAGPFTTSATAQDAHQLRAFILAPQMLEKLNASDGFTAHFSGAEIDPLTRMRPNNALQISSADQFKRYVNVAVNGQEGLIDLTVKAADPAKAVAFATTILGSASSFVAADQGTVSAAEPQGPALKVIVPPTSSELALYPRRIPTLLLALVFFASLYGMVSIFLGTLTRHGQH